MCGQNNTGDIACPITSIEFRNRLNSTVGGSAKMDKTPRDILIQAMIGEHSEADKKEENARREMTALSFY